MHAIARRINDARRDVQIAANDYHDNATLENRNALRVARDYLEMLRYEEVTEERDEQSMVETNERRMCRDI